MKINKIIIILSTWLFWSVIYYFASQISNQLNSTAVNIDVVWFPAGVSVVALITNPKRQWPVYFILFSLINAHFLLEDFGYDYLAVIIINLLTLLTPFIIAAIISYFAELQSQLNNLIMWIFVTMIICALDNIVGFTILYLMDYSELLSDLISSWVADVTGIIYGTTALLGLTSYKTWKQRLTLHNISISLISLVMMLLSAWFVFAEPVESLKLAITNSFGASFNFLLACIPIIFVIIITLFLNGIGRSISLIALGTIVIIYTYQGSGPFFLHGLRPDEPLIIAQSYLSTIAVISLLISILTTTQQFGLNTKSKKLLIRYQLYPEEQKIVFDYLIQTLTMLDKKTTTQNVLQYVAGEEQDKLYQHWFQSDIINGDTVTFTLRNSADGTIKVKDRILMVINNQNKVMLIGEWEVLNRELIAQLQSPLSAHQK